MVARHEAESVGPSSEGEAEVARESGRRLGALVAGAKMLRIAPADEPGEAIELPTSAVRLLVRVLEEMAAGNAVTLVAMQAELTTQEAADLLGVSRPFVIRQMKAGE